MGLRIAFKNTFSPGGAAACGTTTSICTRVSGLIIPVHLRRGICGKGSTKRPGRLQIEQRNHGSARFSSRLGGATRSATVTGVVIVSPQPNGAGEMTEKGRLIRHARPTVPLPVRTPPVPMIEPAFRTLLVAVVLQATIQFSAERFRCW